MCYQLPGGDRVARQPFGTFTFAASVLVFDGPGLTDIPPADRDVQAKELRPLALALS